MSIVIDDSQHTLSLAVRDLCAAEALGGSLHALPLEAARAEIGRTIHDDYQIRQQQTFPGYRKEQPLSFTTEMSGYAVTVQGRIDGLYENAGGWIVEEVKSVLHLDSAPALETIPPSYLSQLKIYLYLWSQQSGGTPVSGQLVLVAADTGQSLALPVQANHDEVREFIHQQVSHILQEHSEREAARSRKQGWAGRLVFPFPHMRLHQDEMIEAIEAALRDQQPVLITAPTGIGKTAAALYAALKYALKNGKQVFFLTSKTTQQQIVTETLHLWTAPGAEPATPDAAPAVPFTSLVLRAKEKSCANDVVFCHPSRCLFARDFYAKLESAHLKEALWQSPVLTPELIYRKAVEQTVCPFELALELLEKCDLIVCDYNYVYDPQVALQRLFEEGAERFIVIIDEAHNLYGRARDYYSSELSLASLQQLRRLVRQISLPEIGPEELVFPELQQAYLATQAPSKSFLGQFDGFLANLESYFHELVEAYPEIDEAGQARIAIDRQHFAAIEEQLDDLTQRYLVYRQRSGILRTEEDELLGFFYSLGGFLRILELSGSEFVHLLIREPADLKIKILCLDPARQLSRRNRQFHSVIGMSATLSPLEFYRDVLGIDRDAQLLALPSPFPPEHRKIMILPGVSTTFKQRSRNARQIAQIIEQVATLRRGNYFAFFPSFAFLEEVAQHLAPSDCSVLIQQRIMPDHARAALLEKLSDPMAAHLVLAVQGGVFAEGVDYPGEMAIGAIIVGPGLPKVCFEQELLRQYYEEQCGQGFEYAYLYPGLNRVIQSAGRIIRSETDRGVILLLDKRFTYENYISLLPRHWYERSPDELIAKGDYLAELAAFWEANKDEQ